MAEAQVEERPDEKQLENQKKLDEYVDTKLADANFLSKDGTYSFSFENELFEFRIPTLIEKTRIKAILASITRYPGSQATGSSEFDIYTSGDLDLMYSSKAITHTAVLLNFPEKFDISTVEDDKIYDLGELIMMSEKRYNDNKKKQSTDKQ